MQQYCTLYFVLCLLLSFLKFFISHFARGICQESHTFTFILLILITFTLRQGHHVFVSYDSNARIFLETLHLK